MCEVRFECLDMVDCEQRYKINYYLCSSSHYLQNGDTDASCESQGIALDVHMAIDKWWHNYLISITEKLPENQSRQQYACNNFSFVFYRVFCLLLLICLTCLPSPEIYSLSFLPSAFQQNSLNGNQALLPGVILLFGSGFRSYQEQMTSSTAHENSLLELSSG